MKSLGIDLAGVEKRETGFCILDEKLNAKVYTLKYNYELIKDILKEKPNIISIDAPLTLPLNRCCLKDTCSCRSQGHLRQCDKDLIEMKIRFLPLTLGPMRKLTERGIQLKKLLEVKGFTIIEVYPGAAQDILNIPRKNKGIYKLREGLETIGIKNISKIKSDHELDAITCALIGKIYLEGNYLALGNPKEGLMIIPKI